MNSSFEYFYKPVFIFCLFSKLLKLYIYAVHYFVRKGYDTVAFWYFNECEVHFLSLPSGKREARWRTQSNFLEQIMFLLFILLGLHHSIILICMGVLVWLKIR